MSTPRAKPKPADAALEIAKTRSVFPCNPEDKRSLTKHGFKDATQKTDTIKAWWTRWPNAMIGVPMGEGDFCVDLDRKPNGGDGVATWDEWEVTHGSAVTRTHATPSTGKHLLFRHEPGIRSIPLDKLGPGIEVKGEGGYIIVPPSRKSDGKEYSVITDGEVAEAPDWLLQKIYGYLNRDFEQAMGRDAGMGVQPPRGDSYPPPDLDELRELLRRLRGVVPARGGTSQSG